MYADIEHVRVPGIEVVLQRMKTLELGVVVPPLLWLYTNEMSQAIRHRSARALESYLVRRMLCALGSQGLNRLFIELLTALENAGPQTADHTIIEFLRRQTVDNRVWPMDEMLTDHLVNEPLKGTVGRQTMVLEAIESYMRGDMTESLGTKSLTRAHIMPQSWQRNWSLPSDVADAEDARVQREHFIKTIGNLTLTTSKLNSSLSNSAWMLKQETLGQHIALRLNWELLQGATDVWDEDTIYVRSKKLAGVVAEIWPFADELLPQQELA